MRPPTPEEARLIARRQAELLGLVSESVPVLLEFAEDMGFDDPVSAYQDPEGFVTAADAWLSSEKIETSDRVWLITRIGYLLGELFRSRYGAHWIVEATPEARFFGKYVLSGFHRVPRPDARLSVFDIAATYVDLPPGRSLRSLVAEADSALRDMTPASE